MVQPLFFNFVVPLCDDNDGVCCDDGACFFGIGHHYFDYDNFDCLCGPDFVQDVVFPAQMLKQMPSQ